VSGRLIRSVCTAALVAAASVSPATAEPTSEPATEPTAAADRPGAVSEMLTRLQALYQQAEEAGETYNAAEEALKKQHAETVRLSRGLARARNALAASRGDAGRLAREQYQGQSDLSSYLHLLLARDPQQVLDQDHLIERAARDRLATMARLDTGAKRAKELAAASRKALDKEQALAAQQKRARDTADARLKAVAELLASLSPEQIAELTAQETSDTAQAQNKLLAGTGLITPRFSPRWFADSEEESGPLSHPCQPRITPPVERHQDAH
jgi:hypothetical protein